VDDGEALPDGGARRERGGSVSASHPSRARLYLTLGRVSNLPTVWTNTVAGVVLAGGVADALAASRLVVALSLFYVGGMFLNDAFDAGIDARERPERPIPSGQISAKEVLVVGFGLLVAGLGLLAWNAAARGDSSHPEVKAGLVLAGCVVLYDVWHKQNPFSPVVMGLCRAAVYVTAGLGAGGTFGAPLGGGALAVGSYVVGLTFVARQENRRSFRAGGTLLLLASPVAVAVLGPSMGLVAWAGLLAFSAWAGVCVAPLFRPGVVNVPRAVVRLIAGISLVDGLFAAAYGAPELMPLGVAGLLTTLALQRWVRGT
jgi:hypothetical protein